MGRKSTNPTTASLVESLDTLDPKEAKKQRRLIRNRLSAQLHRERQRSYMTGLQKQVAALTAERDLWRDAVDAMTAKASVASGIHPEELLGDLQLPLPAEQVAPPPPPPTGQANRNADSLDAMADIMARAQTSILPRGKTSAKAVVTAAASRSLAVAAEAAAALNTRLRPSKRRKSQVSGSCSDDSDATTATVVSTSSRISSSGGELLIDDAPSSDAGPATRRRSARDAKRPALATSLQPYAPPTMSRGLSYLSEDGDGVLDAVESKPFASGHSSMNGHSSTPCAGVGQAGADALPVMPSHELPAALNAIDQGHVADEDDDDETDSDLLTPPVTHTAGSLAAVPITAPASGRPSLAPCETDPLTAILTDQLDDVDDVGAMELPFAAVPSHSSGPDPMAAVSAAFGPAPNPPAGLMGPEPAESSDLVAFVH